MALTSILRVAFSTQQATRSKLDRCRPRVPPTGCSALRALSCVPNALGRVMQWPQYAAQRGRNAALRWLHVVSAACTLPPYFSYFPCTTLMVQRNLVDEGWYRLTAVLIFGVFNGPKRNLNSTTSPRRLFWDFGADQTCTTCWSGGRVHVWVQVQTLASHLAITPEGYSRRQSKVLTSKSIAELLGPRSGTAWVDWTGEHIHNGFPSRRESLWGQCWQRLTR